MKRSSSSKPRAATSKAGVGFASRKKILATALSDGSAKRKKSSVHASPTDKRARVVNCIRSLPVGKVSTYGAIAKGAGWPGAARQVVRILREVHGLPWHRVLGSGGTIKLTGEHAAEQAFRLRMEGVTFRGVRVDMKRHEFPFRSPKR